jgi:hypothetical protein
MKIAFNYFSLLLFISLYGAVSCTKSGNLTNLVFKDSSILASLSIANEKLSDTSVYNLPVVTYGIIPNYVDDGDKKKSVLELYSKGVDYTSFGLFFHNFPREKLNKDITLFLELKNSKTNISDHLYSYYPNDNEYYIRFGFVSSKDVYYKFGNDFTYMTENNTIIGNRGYVEFNNPSKCNTSSYVDLNFTNEIFSETARYHKIAFVKTDYKNDIYIDGILVKTVFSESNDLNGGLCRNYLTADAFGIEFGRPTYIRRFIIYNRPLAKAEIEKL